MLLLCMKEIITLLTVELHVIRIFINRGTFFAFAHNWTITIFNTKSDLQSSAEIDIIYLSLVIFCQNTEKSSTCKTFIVTECSYLFMRRGTMLFDFIFALIDRLNG